MPSGCLRTRTPSASSPRSGVGARRYNSNASAAFSRSPDRTFFAMRSTVIISPDTEKGSYPFLKAVSAKKEYDLFSRHRNQPLEKPQRAGTCDVADFGCVPIEQLQTGAFLVAERVFDIIPQVTPAHRLVGGRAREVLARNFVGRKHPGVPRLLKRLDVGRLQRAGAPSPERIDEWQARPLGPRLTQVDSLGGPAKAGHYVRLNLGRKRTVRSPGPNPAVRGVWLGPNPSVTRGRPGPNP